ncbi:type II toxin-antitoxin system HicA family toxin [Bacteroidota bacterium]
MKSITGKQFVKILVKNNWTLARIKGSHYIYTKKGKTERISVPIHGNKDLKTGLLKHFIKVAGLKEDDF